MRPVTTWIRQLRRVGVLATLLLSISAASVRAESPSVVVLTATGVVDPVMAGYLEEGIAAAARDGATAVVIEIDTPGGSLDATGRIVSTLLEAPVPVIVWVAPAGARAASAGTFITLAANLAYMAPGTNIGAATPVGGSGEDITGDLGEKVRNDAVAKITAIAEARGRPVDWAVATVVEARSSPVAEAVAVGAVDGAAATLDEVLRAASGVTVTVGGGVTRVLPELTAAETTESPMNPFQGFLHLLSDPNIAFILFTLGFYGLLFELQNPNFVTGILGALAIILALVGFGSLPLNVAGLLLIGLAVLLFALEPTVTSHGLLTVGGVVCFILGASALYTAPGDPTGPFVAVAGPVLIVVSATTALFGGFIAWAAIRTRRLSAPAGAIGAPVPAGTIAEVRQPLEPQGTAYAAGEEWSARSQDGRPLARGALVRVITVDGLTLVVAPEPPSSSPA